MRPRVASSSSTEAADATPRSLALKPSENTRVIQTSVDPAGPPPVSTYTSVKVRRLRIAASVSTTLTAGRRAGITMYRKRWRMVTPSTAAAS
ncbi:hypothetical protein BC477_03295 [Clavibacter michiganensis subsp. michiganensis]|uniref:Uncharacterized protein n=1 Tax=Clavibacter michiganensis subsp. michiganensis TaxID=33013 RepID=A0A251XL16_CLAMM|nr:hypothetical protein BC477_03295 [Clavibacter michiganensis subsp. michiganensis]OUE03738.1 hypothetical protein CMMCAS07_02230 [Clavibacter michiganensis subsp. michiganensis]